MVKDVYDTQEELNIKLVIDPPNSTLQYSLLFPKQEEDPEVYYTYQYENTYASTVFSTYPTIKEKKFGKPIADTHAIDVFDNYIILSIADGCGMGSLPAAASKLACKSFRDYLSVELNGKKSPKQIVQALAQSIAYIQTELIASGEDIHSVGLTTFLGCVILKIKGEDDKFVVAYVNVGDCRGVVMRSMSNICWELVSGYKPRIDVTNACGRLGPTDDDKPDLSNFTCGMSICMSGDNLILMSDGIYDNFDPNVLGKSPQDFGINKNVWDETIPEHRKKRNEIFYSLLRELHTEVSPINNQLGKYGFNIVPGKMDHSTFVSLILSNDMFNIKSTIEEELDIPPDMM
ncbi:PPM-type phosphatase domain-containing protein [Entamoeba marina]